MIGDLFRAVVGHADDGDAATLVPRRRRCGRSRPLRCATTRSAGSCANNSAADRSRRSSVPPRRLPAARARPRNRLAAPAGSARRAAAASLDEREEALRPLLAWRREELLRATPPPRSAPRPSSEPSSRRAARTASRGSPLPSSSPRARATRSRRVPRARARCRAPTSARRRASPSAASRARARSQHAAAGRRRARPGYCAALSASPTRSRNASACSRASLFGRRRTSTRPAHHVVERRHVLEQVEALEDHADLARSRRRVPERDRAAIRLLQPREAAQQRRLPRAGRPDDALSPGRTRSRT